MQTTFKALVLSSLVGTGVLAAQAPYTYKTAPKNPFYKLDVVEKLEADTMPKVETWMAEKIKNGTNNGCTLETAAVRQEWADMSEEMRQEYVAATYCLMKLPPKSPRDKYPGAQSRFDDFVAYHMTHAMQLHDTIHLFPAHRYFVWAYEKALRDECNYSGYQPYMNYDRIAQDPKGSPHFNGNASSMGGNGDPDPNYKGVRQPGFTPNIMASGGGGGCVTSGPFHDMNVTLGPLMSTTSGLPKNPWSNGTAANPRCLRRDINQNAANAANVDHMYRLLTTNDKMNGFYNMLLASPANHSDPFPWGIHTGGHYVHAVDPGGDPSTSPGDPVFYFHHGALDRLWWIWQMQDPENRLGALPDSRTMGTMPDMPGMPGMESPYPSGHKEKRQDPTNAVIDLEWLGPSMPLLDAVDQLGGHGGQFCYVYV